MTRFDLSPFFRSSIGFDDFFDLIEKTTEDTGSSVGYPPYNIEKFSESSYRITMALAGFKENDLEITHEKNVLIVSGQSSISEEKDSGEFIYKGIANRSFSRRFNLAENMDITDAEFKDGFLTINISRELPEEEKPKKIAINNNKQKAISSK